jgi:hypothetical protein
MKRLSAPPVERRFRASKMAFARVPSRLGWAALGALAVSATARALFRSGRSPSPAAPRADQEPDVLLDVRELEVDRLTLEVEDLRAHVSLMAELANLVRLSVGVDARLDRVKLEIEGVEANVLLKVRLEHVRAILEKALDTIAEQPDILRILSQPVSEAVRASLGEVQATLSEVLDGLEVGGTVDEVLRGRLEEVRATLEDIFERREVGGGGEETAPPALGEAPANDSPSSAPRRSK